ncbi:oxidase ustYa family protein [Aspergillus clavatus NRRL 1]|uniref:Tat pathway signal sequence n=1 Tax=Aspergillus clavatus (strain ATCC 1007 / CBS 513.65 / DSM 816 / NCTC 3887 / NRRL 1 / QM 1276 / 107) TaxID=344612 RepID=A1CU56_ASPCL|nr:uncharacterized protein ACLA_085380 [Aspergillus clavatus NRRL 1]EAW06843.1 conserved hypothetical protein [Aspergillus clavatus NRRL 1]
MLNSTHSPTYSHLPSESKELLSEDDTSSSSSSSSIPPRTRTRNWRILLLLSTNLALFLTSLGILAYAFHELSALKHNIDNRLVRQTSAYCIVPPNPFHHYQITNPPLPPPLPAPLLDTLPLPLSTTTTNGSFWPQSPPSLFQLPPSPEVDAAWDRIADTHAFALTREQVRRLNKDPAELYRFPASYGLGDEAYMGLLDVFHQLHCLNHLRQAAHPEYYRQNHNHSHSHSNSHHGGSGSGSVGSGTAGTGEKRRSKFPYEVHLEHCTHILLQFVLCHADVGVITFNKVAGTPGPFADFNVDHVCRDFGAVLDWKEANQVNVTDEQWAEIFVTPEGIRELPAEGRSEPPRV